MFLEHALGLRRDVARHDLARRRIERDLPADEDEPSRARPPASTGRSPRALPCVRRCASLHRVRALYSARRPERARPIVMGSANSRSPPCGTPLAMRVIATPSDASSRLSRSAVASPSTLGGVATMTSPTPSLRIRSTSFADRQVLGADPLERRQQPPEHEVAPAHRPGALDGHQVVHARHDAEHLARRACASPQTSQIACPSRISATLPQRSHGPSSSRSDASSAPELPRRARRRPSGATGRSAAPSSPRRREARDSSLTRRRTLGLTGARPSRQTIPGIFTPPVTFSISASICLSACSMPWLIAAQTRVEDEVASPRS